MMKTNIDRIIGAGLIPVAAVSDASKAADLGRALCAGGIPVVEAAWLAESTAEVVRELRRGAPRLVVGAGRIHTGRQAEAAVLAGAAFIATSGFAGEAVEWCLEHSVPVFPGCSTPSDLERALALGLDTVGFFPAGFCGGAKAVQSLAEAYGTLRFLPAGGIDLRDVPEYLALDCVAACRGSWMVPEDLVGRGDFKAIEALCREAVRTAYGFEVQHVGINAGDAAEAGQIGGRFDELFGFALEENPASYFAGGQIEIIKGPFLGRHGHIAVQTVCVDRAVGYFGLLGVGLDPSTMQRGGDGKIVSAYLREEVGGFAVHLKRKS